MTPGVRKFALTVHLSCSVGWIGAVLGYLALGATAVTSPDTQTVRAAWIGMEVTGWWAIVPLALAALVTGLVMSLGTQWGLFRHYWVLISLVLTTFSNVVLILHMPTVSAMARVAQTADGAALRALGGDLFHPTIGLLVLLAITVLNVYKPAGVTPYGWRKQREERTGPQRSTPRATASAAGGAGYFLLRFAEMGVAMLLGMAAFGAFGLALAASGFVGLLDAGWMGVFMVAPMVLWMRLRGCSWRDGAEMGTSMLVPVAAILGLRSLGLSAALPWLANAEHPAMLVAMLLVMLYRRERYPLIPRYVPQNSSPRARESAPGFRLPG